MRNDDLLKKLILLKQILIILSVLSSCSAPITTSKTQSSSVKRLTCTASECDQATLSLVILSGYMLGEDGKDYLVGIQNSPARWEIYSAVELSDGSVAKDRNIKLYVSEKQLKKTGPSISGNESDTLIMNWTPLNVLEEGDSNKITIYIRDVDRCKFKNKNSEDKCEDMTKRMSSFEESKTFGFYISEDEDLEAVAERKKYIGTREVTNDSGAIIKGCLMGAVPGLLSMFLGGGGTAIISAAKGCNQGASTVNDKLNGK